MSRFSEVRSWSKRNSRRLFDWTIRQFIPYAFACRNAAIFRRKIIDQSKTTDLRPEMERCIALDLSDLKEAHDLELKRLDQLRKQAQLNLGASTLAATVALGLAKNDTIQLHEHWFLAGLSIFAIASLVLSALSAISANHTMPIHDLWLQLRRFSFGRPTLVEDHKAKLIKATFLNQAGNLIVQNYAEASSVSMRNAIVSVGIIFIAMIVAARGHNGTAGSASAPETAASACIGSQPPTSSTGSQLPAAGDKVESKLKPDGPSEITPNLFAELVATLPAARQSTIEPWPSVVPFESTNIEDWWVPSCREEYLQTRGPRLF